MFLVLLLGLTKSLFNWGAPHELTRVSTQETPMWWRDFWRDFLILVACFVACFVVTVVIIRLTTGGT
jgi:hypothetical protein